MDAQSSVRAVAMRFLKESRVRHPDILSRVAPELLIALKHIRVCLITSVQLMHVHEIDFIHTFTKAAYPAIRSAAFFSWAKLAVNAKTSLRLKH
jgi:hypothetical protein